MALAAALAILLVLPRASGAASLADPADYVRTFGERAVATLADRNLSPAQRQADLRHLLAANIDAQAIGRFVLGRYGQRASTAEQTEFDRLFAETIVATYTRHLGNYSGETLQVAGARSLDDGSAIVSSKVIRPSGPPASVEWRLRQTDGNWRILDVMVEGVSLALTHRAEYTAVIRADGGRLDGLLERLRAQAAASGADGVRVAAGSD
jgi:phospholipid transport system substrate-binding protein